MLSSLTPEGPEATLCSSRPTTVPVPPDQVRGAVDNGNTWIDAMTTTLRRLDGLCATGITR